MKRLLLACTLCLGLVATSVWLIANPVLAGSATAKCKNGGSVTCSGATCQSQDWDVSSGSDGWCQCTTLDGSYNVKSCASGGGGGGMLIE